MSRAPEGAKRPADVLDRLCPQQDASTQLAPDQRTFSAPAGTSQRCQERKSRIPGFFILRASYRNRGAQLVLIFEAAAALGRFARLGSSRMATRFTFFTSDPACLEPRLCAAYSWPSTGATCGGSLPRYGRPIPNSFPCASTHFQSFSEEAHRWSRVPPWTLTISAASPSP